MFPNPTDVPYVTESLAAFRSAGAAFGSFPLPTANTILAAELLSRALVESNAPPAGAIAVVELKSAGIVRFVAAASGGGTINAGAASAWRTLVARELQSSFANAAAEVLDTAAIFYSPAHTDTLHYIRDAFPTFGAPGRPLTLAELQEALQGVAALPPHSYGVQTTGVQVSNVTLTAGAVHKLLAVGVAMRINAFRRGDLPQARVLLEQWRRKGVKSPFKGPEELITNVEALALPGGNPQQYAYRDNPEISISDVAAVQRKVAKAWEVADKSRYCAEPKVFTWIKSHGCREGIAGQLAMWWDSSRPNRYTFSGSEITPYSSFMLPCSSCSARSEELIAGTSRAVLGGEETVRAQAGTRARSNSLIK